MLTMVLILVKFVLTYIIGITMAQPLHDYDHEITLQVHVKIS
jgi:hypothetical protein